MLDFVKNMSRLKLETLSRRDLFRWSSMLALPSLISHKLGAAPAGSSELRAGADIYQSIGVRPLINARGTYTIIGGSTMLPEVRAAMDAASRHYVHLDELAEAIGARRQRISLKTIPGLPIPVKAEQRMALTPESRSCLT